MTLNLLKKKKHGKIEKKKKKEKHGLLFYCS